jgi:hypothetical protein
MGNGYTLLDSGKESPMPVTFKVGASMPLLDDPKQTLLGAVEFDHPPDGAERLNLGGEYAYKGFAENLEVAVRGGYRFNRDEEGITAGFGIQFPFIRIGLENKPSIWTVDYCYSQMGLLESSNKISLGVGF